MNNVSGADRVEIRVKNVDVYDGNLQQFGYRQELRRSLSFGDLIVFGLICIAPIAPLSIFGFVYNSSHGMVPLVYAAGMVAMLFTALSYMDMSKTFPMAGSVYTYANRTMGHKIGFIAGWAMLLDYLLIPALVYVTTAVLVHTLVPALPKPLLVCAFVAFNTLSNLAGIQTTARLNKVMLALQMLVLAALFVLGAMGLARGVGGAHFSMEPLFDAAKFSPNLIFGSLSIAALSFLGFDAISTLSEEARGGVEMVGRATIVSLLFVGGLFIAQTYVISLFVLNHPSFAPGDPIATAFVPVAQLLGGPVFKWLVSVFAMVVVNIANAMVAQAATARLLFSMARDGRIPRALAHVHPKSQTPRRAILFVAATSLLISVALVNKLLLLTSLVNFGALAGFMMLHASVLAHFAWRNRSKKWLRHWVSPTLGLIVIGYILLNGEPGAKMVGLVWLAIGGIAQIAVSFRKRGAVISRSG